MKLWATSVMRTAVFIAVIVSTSMGCGHQVSPTTPSPITLGTSPPVPPATTVPSTSTVPASINGVVGVYRLDVTMSRSGTATATLHWPDADVSLKLYLTAAGCANATLLLTGGCRILAEARVGNPPVVATSPVMSGDTNTVWVLNPDQISQPVTVSITIQ